MDLPKESFKALNNIQRFNVMTVLRNKNVLKGRAPQIVDKQNKDTFD